MEPNAIYCGDCLDVLRNFPDKSVDLIYLDPPFFTNKFYEVIWKDGAEKRAFGDRWKGGINHYVGWMTERLEQCHRVLKDTGSIFLHCDWHASHYLKVAMDRIFGERNFKNEIIWKRARTVKGNFGQKSRMLGSNVDTILFYSKSEKNKFNPIYLPYSEGYKTGFYKYTEPKTGRRYRLISMIGPGGAAKGNPRYAVMGVTRYWRYSEEKMKELIKQGMVVQTSPGAVPSRKQYLDEGKGVPLQTLWDDIPSLEASSGERLGYPTQKPLALLERIITMASDKGELVLDPFCGCATTLVAAQKLGRRWIGIDVSRTACKLMVKRMHTLSVNPHILMGDLTEKELLKYEPFEFQNWVCEKLGGRINQRKTGDMGIDGWTFDMTPIQVKQSEDVGRNPIDNFQTAIRRAAKKKGIFVAFSFGKGAYEEAARAKNDGIEITLKTVKELLESKTILRDGGIEITFRKP
jgi:DNA modification methylase